MKIRLLCKPLRIINTIFMRFWCVYDLLLTVMIWQHSLAQASADGFGRRKAEIGK